MTPPDGVTPHQRHVRGKSNECAHCKGPEQVSDVSYVPALFRLYLCAPCQKLLSDALASDGADDQVKEGKVIDEQ